SKITPQKVVCDVTYRALYSKTSRRTYEKFCMAKLFISSSEIACLKIAMFIWGAKSVNRY
ncbi:MAG: hypothetical protein ACK466_16040, partial [Pseudanabaena sp.]